jgi:hypothetical protein
MPCTFIIRKKPAATGGGTLELGNPSSTDKADKCPFDLFYNYGVFMNLYPQSEVGSSKTITGLEVYIYKGSSSATFPMTYNNQTIKLMHTTDTEFSGSSKTSYTGFNNSNLTTCKSNFSYVIPNQSEGWITINFDTNFSYNGTDNLIISWEHNDGSYENGTSTDPQGKSTSSSTFRLFYIRQDTSFPNDNFGTRDATLICNYRLIFS